LETPVDAFLDSALTGAVTSWAMGHQWYWQR